MRKLLEDFEGYRSLAREQGLTSARVHERHVVRGPVHNRGFMRGIVVRLRLVHFGAERNDAVALHGRGRAWHEDPCAHAEESCGIRDSEPVVSCRRRNDPARPCIGRQRGKCIVRAAKLERPRALLVLALEVDVHAGERRQCWRMHERRALDHAAQAMRGGENLGGCREHDQKLAPARPHAHAHAPSCVPWDCGVRRNADSADCADQCGYCSASEIACRAVTTWEC